MLTIRVPIKGQEVFNLYVNGKILSSVFNPGRGTLFETTGTVVLQYGWTLGKRRVDHRRGYIVRPATDTKYFRAVYLPNVREPVAIIGLLYGRKIDYARQALFNLEKMYGKDIYLYPVSFWQKISCLLDGRDGKKSLANKSNLSVLCSKYNLWGEKK